MISWLIICILQSKHSKFYTLYGVSWAICVKKTQLFKKFTAKTEDARGQPFLIGSDRTCDQAWVECDRCVGQNSFRYAANTLTPVCQIMNFVAFQEFVPLTWVPLRRRSSHLIIQQVIIKVLPLTRSCDPNSFRVSLHELLHSFTCKRFQLSRFAAAAASPEQKRHRLNRCFGICGIPPCADTCVSLWQY